jgi:hypothetical protein
MLIALLIGAGPVLAGCADFDMDKLDVFGLNEKKKLPGERHPVFPEGVPGVTQGVPPQYMKGSAEPQPGDAIPLETVMPAAPQPENKTAAVAPDEAKPKPVRKRPAPRPTRVEVGASKEAAEAQPVAARTQTSQPQVAPQAASGGGWPPPANAEPSPWPAPVPSGTFSKQ